MTANLPRASGVIHLIMKMNLRRCLCKTAISLLGADERHKAPVFNMTLVDRQS